MGFTIRVTTPGYDALTDVTPDHYSLLSDSDNILIKEKVRGTISVAAGSNGTVAHNLGYIPFVVSNYKEGDNYIKCYGQISASAINRPGYNLGTSNIIFVNTGTVSLVFSYYLFYDNLT